MVRKSSVTGSRYSLHFPGASPRGKVAFSACYHAGIVNVLHHERACFPDVKLHAVIGGFHRSGPTEAIVPDTMRDPAGFDLDVIIPAHCTGWRATTALAVAFGEPMVAPLAVRNLFSL